MGGSKTLWQGMNEHKGDNLFKAKVDENGELHVAHYVGDELYD